MVVPFLVVAAAVFFAIPAAASAACTVEREQANDVALFIRHFSPDCSKVERASQAIPAAEILAALKAGKGLSITNAVITGDMILTLLPSVRVGALSLPERVLAALGQAKVSEVRVIRGPMHIQNSIMDGIVDTQLKPDMVEHRMLGDMLVVQGPVTFRGTTFTQNVDLSGTVFLGPVDSSETIYLGDAFLLNCFFDKPVTFEKTAFAGNTRFYQTIFFEPVTFLRAGFSGLTNFLAVTFKKEAGFSRAYFKMGTGFSGSKFEGISDFSETVFEKAAFFAFTVFAADTYFRRGIFRGEVNFSDADFRGKDDFAKVFYQQEPNFSRAKFAMPRSSIGFENPVFLSIVGVALAAFFIAFIMILKRT